MKDEKKTVIETKKLRTFAWIVGTGFLLIGLAPMAFHAADPRIWALAVAAWLLVQSFAFPRGLNGVYRAWMAVGGALGWVNTRIILALGFFGLILPVGLFLKIRGRDPMRRAFNAGLKSYRVPRTTRDPVHMKHPY